MPKFQFLLLTKHIIYILQKHNLASQNKNNMSLKTIKQTTSNKEFKKMSKQQSMIKVLILIILP